MGPSLEEEKQLHEQGMQRIAEGKVSVNSICPCGSGKKFKKCHGRVVVPVAKPLKLVQNKPKVSPTTVALLAGMAAFIK